MSFRDRWTKKFAKPLTKDEKKAFRLWLGFSEGKISEQEFKEEMDIKVMPRMLGKMSAARINAIEDEVESGEKSSRFGEENAEGASHSMISQLA